MLEALMLVGHVALSYCNVQVEYRIVIKFLSNEGLAPAAIKQRLEAFMVWFLLHIPQ
jgi:hypothetical protein